MSSLVTAVVTWLVVTGLSALILRCDPCTNGIASGYLGPLVGAQVLTDVVHLVVDWPWSGWIGLAMVPAGFVGAFAFLGYAFRWHVRWHVRRPPRSGYGLAG